MQSTTFKVAPSHSESEKNIPQQSLPSKLPQKTYLDGFTQYIKIVGFASGFELDEKNKSAIQKTLLQIDQLINASSKKVYFIWDNDQDGNGSLQYVLQQLSSTYSNDHIGFIRVKRACDPDNLIGDMEYFEVNNVINTEEELASAPEGDWSFHGKIGIDKIVLQANQDKSNVAIFFVGGASTAFAICKDGQPEGEAPYYERKHPKIPLFINDTISRKGLSSKDFGWTEDRGATFQ